MFGEVEVPAEEWELDFDLWLPLAQSTSTHLIDSRCDRARFERESRILAGLQQQAESGEQLPSPEELVAQARSDEAGTR